MYRSAAVPTPSLAAYSAPALFPPVPGVGSHSYVHLPSDQQTMPCGVCPPKPPARPVADVDAPVGPPKIVNSLSSCDANAAAAPGGPCGAPAAAPSPCAPLDIGSLPLCPPLPGAVPFPGPPGQPTMPWGTPGGSCGAPAAAPNPCAPIDIGSLPLCPPQPGAAPFPGHPAPPTMPWGAPAFR